MTKIVIMVGDTESEEHDLRILYTPAPVAAVNEYINEMFVHPDIPADTVVH